MRRVLLFVVFAIVSLSVRSSKTYDFEQGGIYYKIRNDSLWVAPHDEFVMYYNLEYRYQGDIVIPSTVNFEGTEYSVVGIDKEAFRGCSGLTSITIPNSVISIGDGAFWSCTGLTSITIPNGVTSIGMSTFQNCQGLTSITIPNGVTSIGDGAFDACSGLTSITIPNSVTSIGSAAFYCCDNLKKIIISDMVGWCEHSISYGNIWSSPFSNGGYIYSDENTKITNIVPEGTTFIGDGVFYRYSGLTSITIPNGVTSIGDEAFRDCSVKSITIPNSMTSIGKHAFQNCQGLTSITIPNSVTSIGEGAFWTCTGLTSITIPNSVTSIGSSLFGGSTNLISLTLNCPRIVKLFSNVAGATPSSVKEIVLGEEVTSIGELAFQNCSGLTSITIPNSVTSIGDFAFDGCTGLTSITIPNSVTNVGYCAFNGCTYLKTVSFGKSVKKIGERVFQKCDELTSIVSTNPNPPSLDKASFKGIITSKIVLYVPKGSEDAYKNAKGWKDFLTIKTIGEDDNTEKTNTDDTTTDDNNTDDDKTDDGISDGDSGWSINIKIKGEEIAQCSINNIESIEFSEDGLYIIINYKDGKTAKYDLSKFESIDFSENSDNNEGADGNANESNPLTLLTSNDVKYVLLSGPMVSDGDNVNGNLADDGTIYWYMTPQSSWSPQYVHLLLGEKKSISDFPKGYDLGQLSINFGMVRSRENEYDYNSGSIKVTNNDGKSFTLEFNNYKASKSSGASITLNGSLYVEKERYY